MIRSECTLWYVSWHSKAASREMSKKIISHPYTYVSSLGLRHYCSSCPGALQARTYFRSANYPCLNHARPGRAVSFGSRRRFRFCHPWISLSFCECRRHRWCWVVGWLWVRGKKNELGFVMPNDQPGPTHTEP
jgi:hypothetical protein